MTTEEIRRQNARDLANSIGGMSNFARRMSMSISQVSQNIGRTPTRSIGSAMARKIEAQFGKPPGWMDVSHQQYQIDTGLPGEPAVPDEVSNADLVAAIKKVRDPAQRKALVTMLRAFGALEGEE